MTGLSKSFITILPNALFGRNVILSNFVLTIAKKTIAIQSTYENNILYFISEIWEASFLWKRDTLNGDVFLISHSFVKPKYLESARMFMDPKLSINGQRLNARLYKCTWRGKVLFNQVLFRCSSNLICSQVTRGNFCNRLHSLDANLYWSDNFVRYIDLQYSYNLIWKLNHQIVCCVVNKT